MLNDDTKAPLTATVTARHAASAKWWRGYACYMYKGNLSTFVPATFRTVVFDDDVSFSHNLPVASTIKEGKRIIEVPTYLIVLVMCNQTIIHLSIYAPKAP